MATSNRLHNIVAQMIEAGHIHPAMDREAIAAVYARVCERERVPQWDGQAQAWEPWDVARPWGSGPNESEEEFIGEATRQLWGLVDIPPGDWPDECSVAERELAAEIGCHPRSLDDALWLRSQPGVWKHYLAIIRDRLPGSEYHFRDLRFFVRVAQEIGVTRAIRYPHAKTWALVRRFVCDHGYEIPEAFTMHVALGNYAYYYSEPEEWRDVAREHGPHGPRLVAHIRNTVPHISREGVVLALAVPGVEDDPYFREMAPWIEGEPKLTPERLTEALRERPWANVPGQLRWRLLAGQTPKEVADAIEPEAELSEEEAEDWIRESDRWTTPGTYLCRIYPASIANDMMRWHNGRDVVFRLVYDWYNHQRSTWWWNDEQQALIHRALKSAIPERLSDGIKTPAEAVLAAVERASMTNPFGET